MGRYKVVAVNITNGAVERSTKFCGIIKTEKGEGSGGGVLLS